MARDTIFVANRLGRVDAEWTETQNAILSEAGLMAAREAITGWPGYAPTPLHELTEVATEFRVAKVWYKDEAPRFGLGSFKALGGAYAVARLLQSQLSDRLGRPVTMQEVIEKAHPEAGEITVCCATDGNHGRSVAWGAERFGARCVIYIHAHVSEARREAIARYGAEVRRITGTYDDSLREAQEAATREGWFIVSDTSYPGYLEVPRDVMQGYEIMAEEALDALDEPPTHIFLQTGVGGMAAAVAALYKRRFGNERPLVVLADPLQAACWVASYSKGKAVQVQGDLDTIMAGLACGEVSLLAWEILRNHADAVVGLPDSTVPRWMRRLSDMSIVAGESAVAGLAAAEACCREPERRMSLDINENSRILVFGSEGATDPELYRSIIAGNDPEV